VSGAADVIVIGAGANGLALAAYLGKAGRRVLVLEKHDAVGGMARGEEFHPGYRSAGLLHDTSGLRPHVVRDLDLVGKHGLVLRAQRPDVLALGAEGESLWLRGERARAVHELGRASKQDAKRFAEYHVFIERVRPVLADFLDGEPLDLVRFEELPRAQALRRAWRLRRLGKSEMLELLRLPPMCVADWLDEWFETDLLKAALALPALGGTYLGPRSPGSCLNLLLHEAAAAGGDVVGGGAALVAALERAARHHGVEIRTGAAVEQVRVGAGEVAGVTLGSGETLDASTVVATCDPKRALLALVPRGALPDRVIRDIRGFRTRGTTAQVLLALSAPPRFTAAAAGTSVEHARIAPSLIAIERAFDAVKYRAMSDEPVLELHLPAAARPEYAPAGHAVLSVLVHYVPHEMDAPWDDAARERLGNLVVERIERHAPGLAASIVDGVVLGPRDLERRYALSGGHVHHGEHALDQLLIRPVPDCSRYATPLAGFFLCSGGTHPGGGLTCAPAALAAAAVPRGR
jgi:phytoene dehydrogenase-like protein